MIDVADIPEHQIQSGRLGIPASNQLCREGPQLRPDQLTGAI